MLIPFPSSETRYFPELSKIGLLICTFRNDAVVPLHESYSGCPENADGLCSFDHVVEVLKKRSAEIDFNYDCFANYTATAGVDYNGRAPRA